MEVKKNTYQVVNIMCTCKYRVRQGLLVLIVGGVKNACIDVLKMLYVYFVYISMNFTV